ncbi:MAG TPA: GAF domain-containing protein, partial [Longimicrobiaceae bacterium]
MAKPRPRDPSPAQEDPVLRALDGVRDAYRERRSGWEAEHAELEETQVRLIASEGENRRLAERLGEAEGRARVEREAGERQRRRADQLAAALKEIHLALFHGDVYHLILRACLSITGATRGVYVTWRKETDAPRVRAAVEVGGYPRAEPSEFLRALCRKVLDDNRTLVCNRAGDLDDLPAPEHEDERFRNCVAAPVVLLRNFDGIIVAADKKDGEFDADDIEALLSVGDQAAVAVQNLHLERQLQHAYVSTVTMLADAVEAKDPYTHGHCEMASRYARLVAERLELSDYDRSVVCYSALLHDVGKIGVSDGVLNKPGPLL